MVIRRGPSRHTALIGWDRRLDQFAVGQWLYGRIYERRCDLSPDGKHLIYFAMNGRWSSEAKGSWTAVSRAPYLKARTLWAKGDCWNGGGLFLTNETYWLNGGRSAHTKMNDQTGLAVVDAPPFEVSFGGECPGVYYLRLQRDGWLMKRSIPDGKGGEITQFEKPVGRWILRLHAHATLHHPVGRGCYFNTYELLNPATNEARGMVGWEWADVDKSRLVWAREGKLYTGRIDLSGALQETQLFDFNPLKFERLTAPY